MFLHWFDRLFSSINYKWVWDRPNEEEGPTYSEFRFSIREETTFGVVNLGHEFLCRSTSVIFRCVKSGLPSENRPRCVRWTRRFIARSVSLFRRKTPRQIDLWLSSKITGEENRLLLPCDEILTRNVRLAFLLRERTPNWRRFSKAVSFFTKSCSLDLI